MKANKFCLGADVRFLEPYKIGVYEVMSVCRTDKGDCVYRLSSISELVMEEELYASLEEAPLTKLQAMHNMLDGQVYVDASGTKFYARLDDLRVSFAYDCDGDICELYGLWGDVATWTPYTPPKEWYEEIPEGGVLCWVSDQNIIDKSYPQMVTNYEPKDSSRFKTEFSSWVNATPVKPEECLQVKEA